jgi:CheY-like chemotaxis protein
MVANSNVPPADVLFIEDQNMLRMLVREAFGYEGISAIFAADGCEALDLINQIVANNAVMPRIIFLDILMPCLDGYELFNKLCEDPYLNRMNDTTIVITSAAQEALNLPTGKLQPKVLYKPYEVGTLIEMVRNIAPDLFAKL